MEAAQQPRELTLREKLGVKPPAEVIDWINLLVYGDPGVGKTRLMSTAQDHEGTAPILFLDIDGGVTTLRKRPDIDVRSIRSIQDITDIYNEVVKDTSGYYRSIVIDSLTELQKLDMTTVMRSAPAVQRGDQDPDVPSQREWGKSSERIRRIVRAYRDLPMNTLFTAHAYQVTDKDGNLVGIYPSLPGKLRIEISGFLDIVGYMFVDLKGTETIRKLQFAKTKRVIAKDRTDSLGDLVEAPGIPLLWEKIHGSE